MTTPATRTPVRIARGTYSDLNTSIADILDGEICWATDEDKIYVKDGGSLVATMLVPGDIGVTVQAYDVDTTKNDVANTFTAEQTFNAGLSVDGPYEQAAEAMAALDVDCSTGNYFTKAISTSSTITFSNIPATGTVFGFTLELTLTGASTAITWPAAVKWNSDTAPTLTDARTHLFMFTTSDGGTTIRGAALVDYTA